jgi:hypothetical protein
MDLGRFLTMMEILLVTSSRRYEPLPGGDLSL